MAKNELKSRFQALLDKLPIAQQQQLLEFAEFLTERHAVEPVTGEPLPIARPDGETVVAAMKRLRETYPMLDPEDLVHEASGLMGAHVLQGKPASVVIDELEQLFLERYQALAK